MTIELPAVGEQDLHRPPRAPGEHDSRRPGPPAGPPPNVWVYKGRAYDLTDWISKHPGGAFFIGRSNNRDITSIIHAYHKNPQAIERMLERYALHREARPEDVHPKCNAPEFLFKEDFNSWDDTPRYRFDNKDDLLHRVKVRLKDPQLAARINKMDKLFNIVVVGLAVAYLAVQGVRLAEPHWMPVPLLAPGQLTRNGSILPTTAMILTVGTTQRRRRLIPRSMGCRGGYPKTNIGASTAGIS